MTFPLPFYIPRVVSASSWLPTDLTNLRAWYDFSDLSTMWQNSAMTTAVASSTDPIRVIEDKSANGFDLDSGSDAARPTYTESGGLRFADFDGSNDYLGQTTSTVFQNSTTTSVFIALEKDAADNEGVIYGDASGAGRFGGAYDSSTNAPYAGFSTNPSIYIDNVALSAATRTQLHSDLDDSASHVVEFRDFIVTSSTWVGVNLSYIGGGVYHFAGRIYNVVIGESVSAGERTELYTYLNGKAGL